jgi:ribosome-binding protein aMBF1 (putative translation factor)
VSGAIRFSTVADEWKRDAEFVAEYRRIGPAMELAFALGEARRAADLTQAEVARRMESSQAAVARLESGYARAIGRRATVRLEPIEPAL